MVDTIPVLGSRCTSIWRVRESVTAIIWVYFGVVDQWFG